VSLVRLSVTLEDHVQTQFLGKKRRHDVLHIKHQGRIPSLSLGSQSDLEEAYNLGVDPNGDFTITKHDQALLRLTPSGDLQVIGNLRTDSLVANQLVVTTMPQWKFVSNDMFSNVANTASPTDSDIGSDESNGWTFASAFSCASFRMITSDSQSLIQRTYSNLPSHNELRLSVVAHFIDDWQGETGYMKVDDNYVWTQSHDQRNVGAKLNVCGSDAYPESRLSLPIDVILPHSVPTLTVTLGSTLESGAEALFGVSSVALFLRDSAQYATTATV